MRSVQAHFTAYLLDLLCILRDSKARPMRQRELYQWQQPSHGLNHGINSPNGCSIRAASIPAREWHVCVVTFRVNTPWDQEVVLPSSDKSSNKKNEKEGYKLKCKNSSTARQTTHLGVLFTDSAGRLHQLKKDLPQLKASVSTKTHTSGHCKPNGSDVLTPLHWDEGHTREITNPEPGYLSQAWASQHHRCLR